MSAAFNIAYLTPHSEIAGGERILLDLCAGLNPARFKPFVIVPRDGSLANQLRKAQIPVAVIPFRRDLMSGFPPAFNLTAIKAISKKLMEWNISLLHLQDSYLTLLGGLAARAHKIPVVLTAHGVWDAHFFYQDVLNRLFLKKIWVPTEHVASGVARRNIVSRNIISEIPFGVDAEHFSLQAASNIRAQCGFLDSDIVIARIARFDAVKDYPSFLEAANQVGAQFPHVKFLVLGDTKLNIPSEDKFHKEYFLNYLDRHPRLKRQTYWAGHQEDVVPFLKASDILVSSSRSESFGLTLLEAMSMERPVVSTRVGGPSVIVVDGVTGILVPPQNPARLAEAMTELIANPDKRISMGKQGRARVLQSYQLKQFVKSMEHEYRGLLAE